MYQTIELANHAEPIEDSEPACEVPFYDIEECQLEEKSITDDQLDSIDATIEISDVTDPDNSPARQSISESVEEVKLSSFETDFNVYIRKFYGVDSPTRPGRQAMKETAYSTLIIFIGISTICIVDHFYLTIAFQTASHTDVALLTGAFAATSGMYLNLLFFSRILVIFVYALVLIYDLHFSPYSQPRNVFGSHVMASFIGVCVRKAGNVLGVPIFVQGPVAVALALFSMNIAVCIHPPGGATALIAVIGGSAIEALGFGYVLTCAGAATICIIIASITNNLFRTRQYPKYWI